jgi:hypothetical protein
MTGEHCKLFFGLKISPFLWGSVAFLLVAKAAKHLQIGGVIGAAAAGWDDVVNFQKAIIAAGRAKAVLFCQRGVDVLNGQSAFIAGLFGSVIMAVRGKLAQPIFHVFFNAAALNFAHFVAVVFGPFAGRQPVSHGINGASLARPFGHEAGPFGVVFAVFFDTALNADARGREPFRLMSMLARFFGKVVALARQFGGSAKRVGWGHFSSDGFVKVVAYSLTFSKET